MKVKTVTGEELNGLKNEDFEPDNEFVESEQGEDADSAEADLIAASDAHSAEEMDDAEMLSYVVKLSMAYDNLGESVREVDLGGLEELTTMDAQMIDRIMERLNHFPRNKYRDTVFCKHVAMRVTGLPVEFFNQLKWVDMNRIASRITIYFLFS